MPLVCEFDQSIDILGLHWPQVLLQIHELLQLYSTLEQMLLLKEIIYYASIYQNVKFNFLKNVQLSSYLLGI